MNLKHHLLIRIVLIALVGLLTTAAIVLYQENQQAQQQAQLAADSIDKQLELQLFRIDAGFGHAEHFPDFDLWKQTSNTHGLCVQFTDVNGVQQRSVCKGENMTAAIAPHWFKGFYQWVFHAHFKVVRLVAFKGIAKGSVTVTPSRELAIAHAWQRFRSLMAFSVSTTVALCLMITVSMRRALAPAQVIVDGLETIQRGELSFRLPSFELQEWQQTGAAINQLVASQEQLLLARKKLALQLMTVQEEERRYLARELHDEFGQCLAAINAISASISQTAALSCPAIVPESENISHISQHILVLLRELLLRLRPTAIDELGLAISLQSLINDWSARSIGKTIFTLDLHGAIEALPEPLSITLFRIVQECLTNITKHAAASQVVVTLVVANQITLTVKDNGSAKQLPFTNPSGIGLLGMRERLDALGGQLVLDIVKPSGLMVQASLPLPSLAGVAP